MTLCFLFISGLLRGSTIGTPRKATSQFYDDVLRKNRVRNSDTSKTVYGTMTAQPGMEREEDIDVDGFMKSLDMEVEKRASGHDSAAFDDTEEWEKVRVFLSFFVSLTQKSLQIHF